MKKIVLRSPAKVNLFLRLINKRPDGYHNIETLFQRISLFDDVIFQSNSLGKIKIICHHPHVPKGTKNLVYKVADMLRKDFNIDKGVTIRIKKRIPVAAGLAGGSSNAATALIGLNKLWDLKLSKKRLLAYARKIGSDVSFFINDCSFALGTERGDNIKRININNKLWQVIVVPRIKLYSKDVYAASKLQLTKINDNVSILIHNLKKNNIIDASTGFKNDLQAAVCRLAPNLASTIKTLNSLKLKGVMISGSGPSVFGLTDSARKAKTIEVVLKKRFSQVFAVKTF